MYNKFISDILADNSEEEDDDVDEEAKQQEESRKSASDSEGLEWPKKKNVTPEHVNEKSLLSGGKKD